MTICGHEPLAIISVTVGEQIEFVAARPSTNLGQSGVAFALSVDVTSQPVSTEGSVRKLPLM